MSQVYLIQEKNGRFYAKFRKPDGKWTKKTDSGGGANSNEIKVPRTGIEPVRPLRVPGF